MNIIAQIDLRAAGIGPMPGGFKKPKLLSPGGVHVPKLAAKTPTKPVHDGAHSYFNAHGYQMTGNKLCAGKQMSCYFRKRASGNSHDVKVDAEGNYIRTARTAKGIRARKGLIDAKGMRCKGGKQ